MTQSIELKSVGASASATSKVDLGFNLTSTESIHTYDTTSALTTSLDAVVGTPTNADYVADVRLFDAQGAARDISIAYTKRANNKWDFTAYTDGGNLVGGTEGTNTRIGNGQLHFNTDGSLRYVTGDTLSADWADQCRLPGCRRRCRP